MEDPGRARLDRPGVCLTVGARGQDQHHAARISRAQLADQLRPIAVGEVEVNDREVGAFEHAARLGQRPGLRYHLELRLTVEHEGERLAESRVVVDQQYAGHRSDSSSKRNTDPPSDPEANVRSSPWACRMRRLR